MLIHTRSTQTSKAEFLVAMAGTDCRVLLLDSESRCHAASPSGKAIVDRADALAIVDGRLRAIRDSDNAILQQALAAASSNSSDQRRCLSLPRRTGRQDYLLSIQRLLLDGIDNALNLTIVDPEQDISTPAKQIQQLFDLTTAQTDLARLLGNGLSLDDSAQELGVKISTARSHLGAIFRKTRTNRIEKLVQVLAVVECSSRIQAAVCRASHLMYLRSN